MTFKIKVSMIPSFKHKPPEGMFYEVEQFKNNVFVIWICFNQNFSYNNGKRVKCCWGFYDISKCKFYRPVNSKTVGKEIQFKNTTSWSSLKVSKPILT